MEPAADCQGTSLSSLGGTQGRHYFSYNLALPFAFTDFLLRRMQTPLTLEAVEIRIQWS